MHLSLSTQKRVPLRYWESQENQRNFLEQFAKQHNIKQPYEWGRVSVQKIKSSGGSFLNEYRGSLRKALQSLYGGLQCYKLIPTYRNKLGR